MSAAIRKLKVDVTSDTICPFCILGVRQLQVAAQKYSEKNPSKPVELDLHFHPFQLGGPDKFTEKPISRLQYSEDKFGKERTAAFSKSFDTQYKALGLDGFDPDGQLSSSHLGHRLTAYAQEHKPEAEAKLAVALMENYQVKGKSPSDRDELARIAVELGVFDSADKAKDWLATNDKDALVRQQYQDALRKGVSGVPHFIFQDKYATSGAIGVEDFEDALGQIAAREGN